MTFVLRVFHSGRDDRSTVMVSEFHVAPVDLGLVSGVPDDAGLEIIRDQKPWYSVKVFVRMYMSEKPVLGLHVVT